MSKVNCIKSSIFIAVIFMLIAQSCSESLTGLPDVQRVQLYESRFEQSPMEFKFINKKFKKPENLAIWEAQLDKVIEYNFLTMHSGLKLISYEFVQEIVSIEDLETIKKRLVKNNSYFIIYNESSNHFKIGENREFAENYADFLDLLIPTSEEKFQATLSNNKELFSSNPTYIFKKNDLGIVNLKWQHEGQIINTQCIISKKNGIIYDKFLYFIHFPIGERIQMQVFPTTRSYTDSIPPDLNGPISYTWSVTDEAYNYFNIRVWYYNIICNVYGEKVMGIKSINDKSLNAYSDYALGFSSDAKVIEFSFSSGFDGHLNFGWAWTHKIGLGAQISFFDNGFRIDGGGANGTGIEYVRPDELK